MASKVELANIALANIHVASINSFGEASQEAQYISLFYPKVRDALFEMHDWSFIRNEKPLALLSDELFDWAYCYQYPSDCERINCLKSPVNQVQTADTGFAFRPYYYDDNPFNDEANLRLRIPYEVRMVGSNKVIGANEPDLWVDYRTSNDDPNKYSSLFFDAFCWRLGAEVAIPIIGGDVGRAERQNAFTIFNEQIKMAMAEDMNQSDRLLRGGIDESEFTLVKG